MLATSNKDKAREIAEILDGTPFVVTTMKEEGFDPDIVEDGKTFEENALIKARAVHSLAKGAYVMADDSGLCIDALDGAPGIYSARFCGEDSTYPEKFAKIFEMLKDVPEEKRTAKFVCSIAVVRPDGSEFTVRGEICGVLHEKPMGDGGFGYDPIFYVPEFGMTTAQMTKEQKNSISHRGKASRAMAEKLKAELG
ncbi:MAG: RdgB/HAM1 family non-canonical purine NTP pyrophosphatase [Clostridiales bacterium]|nr:RdgB/HAM1 family non-canonical purine NTP pyrophosphatase [Clostridiales bacterium]